MNIPENPIPPCPDTPNCYRTSHVFNRDPSSAFEALKISVRNAGAEELTIEGNTKDKTIKATFRIPLFGWKDDVTIKIKTDSSGIDRSFVFLKSSSREGYYDFRVNKRRIKRILKKAHKEINN
ncbi:MAG: DUF1499 domain-containing protein [Balneola sp.]